MSEVVRTVGRYQILSELGRGGMAVVYLARQVDLDREVALKELAAFHLADPTFAIRFERESRFAGSLNHPNIVTVHDYFVHDGVPYIAMEYVRGGSLRPRISRLTLAQILGSLEGVLAGLAHAHERGVVHRDLKPENLMVTADGRIKIADFGIAKALDPAASSLVTATGLAVGTPAYMAPEQAMAQEIGAWTDLYSTGVIAYELLVGQVPFPEADTPVAILMRHVNDPIPSPRSLNPDLDPRLAEWTERLLVKSSADRPRDAVETGDALEEIAIDLLGPRWKRDARLLDGDGAEAVTPERMMTPTVPARAAPATRAVEEAPPAPLPPPAARRRRLWIGALLALVGATAAGVVAFVLADRGGSDEETAATEPTATAPPSPPTLTRVTFSENQQSLSARLELVGASLQSEGVQPVDAAIGDGSASVAVEATGIRTRVAEKKRDGLAVRVSRPESGRLLVTVSARSGAFVGLQARLASPQAVVLEMRKLARPTTARSAINSLIQAWKAGDRGAALSVADKAVVTKLFRVAFPEPAPTLQDCLQVGTGQVDCTYEYDFERRFVSLRAVESGGIYRVLEVAFGRV